MSLPSLWPQVVIQASSIQVSEKWLDPLVLFLTAYYRNSTKLFEDTCVSGVIDRLRQPVPRFMMIHIGIWQLCIFQGSWREWPETSAHSRLMGVHIEVII